MDVWAFIGIELQLECVGRSDNVYDRIDWRDWMGWDGMEWWDMGTDGVVLIRPDQRYALA